MTQAMSAVERVWAAVHFLRPDRVPVALHNFQPAAAATGLPLSQVFRDGALLAEAMLRAWREFGHDMILLDNGTACSAQACGADAIYREDAAPVAHRPVLRSLEEVASLQVPDPYRAFPMCELLKATRILRREVGDRAWICARADQGPMGLAAQLLGINQLMIEIALGERETLIHSLLDYCRRVATRLAQALIECGGHSTCIGESISGPAMMSPRHYRRYAQDYQRQMVEQLRAQRIVLHLHICGNTQPILEDMVATGAPILEIDHKTDPHAAKAQAHGKAALLGNLDTGLLASGTPAEVEDACREAMEVMGSDGGFILGPGCAMSTETPSDNIHALVESARRSGHRG